MSVTRREFLNCAAPWVLAAATTSGSALAAMGPNDKFDLVIKGGDVLDPSQSLRGSTLRAIATCGNGGPGYRRT